jgi:hypothetical protein
MGLAIKGITKISELAIDADKDMTVHGLFNLKEVVAGMARGDVAVRGASQLIVVPAGPPDYVFTSTGRGKLPVWAPAGGGLKYYFPVEISLSHGEAIVAPAHTYNKNAPIASNYVDVYVDTPAQNVKMLSPAIALTDAEAIVAAAASYNRNAGIGRDISTIVEGAVSEDWLGAQVDETLAAQSAVLNDMHLCPMTPHVNDKYYIGASWPFPRLWFYLSTQGSGNWSNQWYYWNGAWVPCVGEVDNTSSFQATAGIYRIEHTPQVDWALSVIQGMNLYWLKCETTAFVNQITAPLGAQVFCSRLI